MRKEVPMLQKLVRQGDILLLPLRPLDVNQRHKELEYLLHFFDEEEFQIAHLACHAFDQKPSSQSYLDVANNFHISIEDFRARKLTTKYNPLVILNACLTGITDSLCISGWAAEFWKGGARGVVATEFQVPDWFAAVFIEKLYEHLLSGEPLGESLWATRSYFWEREKNPLGLAYALYAPLAIRITGKEKTIG
jgi:CHAT domain-containing protein